MGTLLRNWEGAGEGINMGHLWDMGHFPHHLTSSFSSFHSPQTFPPLLPTDFAHLGCLISSLGLSHRNPCFSHYHQEQDTAPAPHSSPSLYPHPQRLASLLEGGDKREGRTHRLQPPGWDQRRHLLQWKKEATVRTEPDPREPSHLPLLILSSQQSLWTQGDTLLPHRQI